MPITTKNAKGFTQHYKNSAGFSLIELIVSLALFSVVMLISSGAYLLMINLNYQAQALAFGVDNLSFALETMTRSIRTGTNYGCKNPRSEAHCSGTDESSFNFTDIDGNTIVYKFDSDNKSITKTSGAGPPYPITDTSLVRVTRLDFYVKGVDNHDTQQPYVTIVATGNALTGPGKGVQPFGVETSAVMRGPDIGGL